MTKSLKNMEWINNKFTPLCLLFLFALPVQGAYFSTLPKGVRTAVFHHLFTDEIQGTFDTNGAYNSLKKVADIDAGSLYGIDSSIDTYLNDLKTNNPSAYDAFTLGTYEVDASARVHVNALGVGYGLTNRITAYFFTPHFSADVNIDVKKTKVENYDTILTGIPGVSAANLPSINDRMVQSVIVNYYGYKPLGNWLGKDFGDTEIGFMYRPVRGKRWGLLVTPGIVAPTGREDDQDMLQDFAFGDGQWDAFLEVGAGFEWRSIAFDLWGRFTYQFPTHKEIRQPESVDVPVTSRKGRSYIKLGNKLSANIQGHYILNSLFTLSILHSVEYKSADNYESIYSEADTYWESNTEVLAQSYKLTLETTTVKLFKKKVFWVPLTLYLSFQRNYAGKNAPYYSRYDFEFRLFF